MGSTGSEWGGVISLGALCYGSFRNIVTQINRLCINKLNVILKFTNFGFIL
jgi:hypothetical protein